MATLAWREYAAMTLPGRKAWQLAGVPAVAAIGLLVWFWEGLGLPHPGEVHLVALPAVVFVVLALPALTWNGTTPTFTEGALCCLGILYTGYLPAYAIALRRLEHGEGLALSLVATVKIGDSGAYFIGRALGRHRFFPVSPRKTIEGALGHLATSVLTALACWQLFFPAGYAGPLAIIVAAVVLSVVAQLGDLIESHLKRSFGTKDSSSVVPELGGILDMVDSLLFAGPALYGLAVAYAG
jgi:phosphatidate cytidylyltransferase